jgi:hypothetical protein
MNIAANLQRLLARQRNYITDLHDMIDTLRQFKSEADLEGDLEQEYRYHSELVTYRKELAKVVSDQKAIKALLKEI